MKKQFFLPILALVLGIAASAFTTNHNILPNQEDKWWYTGTTDTGMDVAENYEPLNGQNSSCVPTGTINCVVEAPEDPNNEGFPDLTQGIVRSYKP